MNVFTSQYARADKMMGAEVTSEWINVNRWKQTLVTSNGKADTSGWDLASERFKRRGFGV